MKIIKKSFSLIFLFAAINLCAQVRFAVIGDYGSDDPNELNVSVIVKSWNPDFIVTNGDNNYYAYTNGDSIDYNVGRYYHEYIKPYLGNFGNGSSPVNRFFPGMGNHDLYDGVWYGPGDIRHAGYYYYHYFSLTDTSIHKGNTPDAWEPTGVRYYTFTKGNVQFFMLNTGASPEDHHDYFYTEPDGVDSNSVQGQWLKNQLANSTAKWKIVVMHHPPYASTDPLYIDYFPDLRWNFKKWGASAVISGHLHTYESLVVGGLPYFINGLGGEDKLDAIQSNPYPGSRLQYNAEFGALLCQSYADSLVIKFINTNSDTIDSYKITGSNLILNDAGVQEAVSSFPGTIYTGTNLCFNAKVKNYGSNTLFFVPVKYSVNGGPPAGSVSTGAMNVNDSALVSFCGSQSFTPTTAGVYNLKFFTELSGDTVHSNDTATLVLTVIDSSRDAGVTSVTSDPSGIIYAGENISFNATVKNFGLNNLSFVPVSFSVNNIVYAGPILTDSLKSNDSTSILFNVTLSFTPAASGVYDLKFFTSLSGDTIHSNDTATLVLTVIDSSRDAGVTSVTSIPSGIIYTGENVSFNAAVKNFGQVKLSSVPVSYIINDSITKTISSGDIFSGDSSVILFNYSQSFTPTSAGVYNLKFFTSLSGDTIHTNDTATLVLTVIDSSRDAGVTSVTSNPSGIIYTGGNVTFNAAVKNFGQVKLSSVPVSYIIIINSIDSITKTISSGDIFSGDSSVILFHYSQSFTPTSAGVYNLKFFTSLSGDTIHSNDTARLVLTVIDSSRDAGVTSVTSNPSGIIYTGGNVTFNAAVKNFGQVKLSSVPVSYIINDSITKTISSGNIFSGDSSVILFNDSQSFTPTSAGTYNLKFFTTLSGDTIHTNDTATLVLTVIDSSRDAGVTSVTSYPSGIIYTGENVTFNVTVKNFGQAKLSEVPVSYIANNTAAKGKLENNDILSGDSSVVKFDTTESFSAVAAGVYVFKFFTSLTEDTIHSNDTTTFVLTVIDSIKTTLNITIIPEGFYNLLTNKLNMRDTIKVSLREINSPYAIDDSSYAVLDSVSFRGVFEFSNIQNGIYFIVITHRNSIETWSKAGGEPVITQTIMYYDFTDTSTKAYSGNLKQINLSPARFAIYSGDVNQDGTVDLTDQSIIDNDSYIYASGYVLSDLSGDRVVDLTDAAIAENNAINFIVSVTP